MTRSKHGRERKRGSSRSPSHSHRANRRADRKAARKAERAAQAEQSDETEQVDRTERPPDHRVDRRADRTDRRTEPPAEQPAPEKPAPERHHLVAEVEPLDVDGVRTVAIGSVIWIVAFLAMLPFIGTLRDHDKLSWLWICIAGFGLGLIGLEYCRRRRRLLTEQPDRRRTEASRFGAAGN